MYNIQNVTITSMDRDNLKPHSHKLRPKTTKYLDSEYSAEMTELSDVKSGDDSDNNMFDVHKSASNDARTDSDSMSSSDSQNEAFASSRARKKHHRSEEESERVDETEPAIKIQPDAGKKLTRRKSIPRGKAPMQVVERAVEHLNLAGISTTFAKDIEQILHSQLLVKFYLFDMLVQQKISKQKARAEALGVKKSAQSQVEDEDTLPSQTSLPQQDISTKPSDYKIKEEDLTNLLTDLARTDPVQRLVNLKTYFDSRKGESNRNMLSAIILVTYIDASGTHTVSHNIETASNAYNILDNDSEEFRELIRSTHGADPSAFRDFHTETALMVLLEQNLTSMKEVYGNKIERISIFIDSRLSSCNSCAEKMQSTRERLLGDIRLSISMNYSAKYDGHMGNAISTHPHHSSSASVSSGSGASSASSVMTSPMVVSSQNPLRSRDTPHHRASPLKSLHRPIIANAVTFISGSCNAKQNPTKDITLLLNEQSANINAIVSDIIHASFPHRSSLPRHTDLSAEISEEEEGNNHFVDQLTSRAGVVSPDSKGRY